MLAWDQQSKKSPKLQFLNHNLSTYAQERMGDTNFSVKMIILPNEEISLNDPEESGKQLKIYYLATDAY